MGYRYRSLDASSPLNQVKARKLVGASVKPAYLRVMGRTLVGWRGNVLVLDLEISKLNDLMRDTIWHASITVRWKDFVGIVGPALSVLNGEPDFRLLAFR